jgi:hypothetical protein
MARVQSVGAIATIAKVPGDVRNIHLRLFAKTDTGLLAIDPRPQSAVCAGGEDVAGLLAMAQLSLGVAFGSQLPAAMREGHWGRVVETLSEQFDISTDVETLMALPFDLIPDGELRDSVESG